MGIEVWRYEVLRIERLIRMIQIWPNNSSMIAAMHENSRCMSNTWFQTDTILLHAQDSPLAAHIQGAINERRYIKSPTYSFIHSYQGLHTLSHLRNTCCCLRAAGILGDQIAPSNRYSERGCVDGNNISSTVPCAEFRRSSDDNSY